jgi:uncharacterized protein (DUF433 family)
LSRTELAKWSQRDHFCEVPFTELGTVKAFACDDPVRQRSWTTRSRLCLRYDYDVQQFERITMDPEVMGGKPCIRGMRVTVGMIVGAMSTGRTIEQLLADFPYIEEADIREALAFAASLAQGHEIRLAS